ncbi:BREX-1 system adenine-specific DNA-methyltransferase PglX [Jeotgalibaca caeni]|uniref:BREX-1 system adenine-specific DNA-methyltransferase PglX n=1 Tax=Jeotgalibaca caeni TaxID=3028623 RepID=UPI00237E9442|nr:BREX-1 system adenine-specific DNA-methyltransferase PglX [Jeotgalibaca caeni]MDE1547823.1 BREX-1 system adenine-specific DNA-methyltransferase PglX [Jeotgalibaca caeni]
MAKGAFFKEATVDVMSLVIKNSFEKSKGDYIRLESFKGDMEFQGLKFKEIINNKESNYIYKIKQAKFVDIPGMPIAYWVSNTLLDVFKKKKVYDLSISSGQNVTSNNNRFVRHFWELDQKNIGVTKKWLPYAKGGGFRKWYGNIIDVVDWSAEAREFYKKNSASRIISEEYWYRKAITWGLITSSVPSFRVLPPDSTFDKGGSSIFIKEESHFNYLLAVFNSNIFPKLAEIMNPTLNFQVKDVRDIPIIFENNEKITKMVDETIELSKHDWNSYEHSYKFKKNPLIKILNEKKKKHDTNHITIEACYEEYKKETNNNFYRLKELEEKINKLLIDAYNLNDEIKHWVSEKDVTVTKVVDEKKIKDKLNSFCMDKREVVESFISYIVGCLLGRYNSNLDINTNKEIIHNNDKGIDIEDGKLDVLIMSDAGYSNANLINQFVFFIQEKFGEKYLESNLNFIAESLNNQGTTSREVIENYFLNDFYNDHVKYFKKRPIYWQYDSGKQNGFKALVYMHRYDEDTTGKVRVEYLHQVQRAYERTIANLQEDIIHTNDAKEITQIQKHIEKLTKQLKECREYDERLGHMALERVAIDLDDGVKVNYEKVQTDSKGKFHQILAKI